MPRMSLKEIAAQLAGNADVCERNGLQERGVGFQESSQIVLNNASERTSGRNPVKLTCECPRSIRCFPEVLDKGPIICGACGQDFD